MRFSSSILVALSIAQQATCWGDLGHRTVALLAQKYLTTSASEALDSILANDKGYDFSDAAVFADRVKRQRPFTKTWHYVGKVPSTIYFKVDWSNSRKDARDTPFADPPKCGLNYPADCTYQRTGCVISAINNHTAIFLSPATKDKDRQEALMFLIHFVGDLHQPLHVEDAYRGGNLIEPVKFGAVNTLNLHSVWDASVPHKMRGLEKSISDAEEKVAAAEWADELFALNTQNGVHATSECNDVETPDKCPLLWANKSNWWICKYVLAHPKEWFVDRESNDLGEEYYEGAKPIVEELVGLAGARLGAWLNALAAGVAQKETVIGEPKGFKANQQGQKVFKGKEERVDL